MLNQNFKEFKENHYTYREIQSLFTRSDLKKFIRITVPKEFAVDKFKGCKYAYIKPDDDTLKNRSNKYLKKIAKTEINSNLYISSKDAINLLQLKVKKWLDTKIFFNLEEVYLNYYLISDTNKIYHEQKLFMSNYLSLSELKQIIIKNHIDKLSKYEIPCYAYAGKFFNRMTAYSLLEVTDYISKGFAKDGYYIKNNISLENKAVRRNNLRSLDSHYFKDMIFDDFFKNFYVIEEIQSLLIRRFQDNAIYINIPSEFRIGKFSGKYKAYEKNIF